MLSQLGNYFFTISNVFADLENYQNLQFILSDQVFQELIIENSVFLNGSSVTFGGCMQFVVSEFGAISKIYLTNTTFGSCQSRFLGGAVYGVQLIKAQNSKIFNCESRIGGGLYLYDYVDVQELSNIQFKNNRGLLLNDNYSSQIQKFIIEEAIEIFSKDKEGYSLIPNQKYLYPGLTYLFRLSIKVDNKKYDKFNDHNSFGNIYSFLFKPSENYLQQTLPGLESINYPYILWQAINIDFLGNEYSQLKLQAVISNLQFFFSDENYQIQNGCKDQGMEKQYISIYENRFSCQYCDRMKASYSSKCEACHLDYFKDCYANYSNLRESYWRSSYSVNSSDIQYCSLNPSSCIGGFGVQNDLCYEGHIGAQCLDCDIKRTYWNDTYTSQGVFQCTKCNSIESNTSKIVLLIIFLIVSLLVFRQNQLEQVF